MHRKALLHSHAFLDLRVSFIFSLSSDYCIISRDNGSVGLFGDTSPNKLKVRYKALTQYCFDVIFALVFRAGDGHQLHIVSKVVLSTKFLTHSSRVCTRFFCSLIVEVIQNGGNPKQCFTRTLHFSTILIISRALRQ